MLAWLEQFLVRYPELALFLVIAGGYWIGSFKVGHRCRHRWPDSFDPGSEGTAVGSKVCRGP